MTILRSKVPQTYDKNKHLIYIAVKSLVQVAIQVDILSWQAYICTNFEL